MRRIFILIALAVAGCASAPPPENCAPLYRADGTVVRPCGTDAAPALPDDAQRSSAGALDKVYKEDRPR